MPDWADVVPTQTGPGYRRRLGDWSGSQWRRIENRISRPLRVFIYHRVAYATHDPWSLAVSPVNFDEQLAVLSSAGRIVSLHEEMARRLGGRQPTVRQRRFAVTFDDGYADNLEAAVPLLERHDAPATVFVATHFIDQPYFWWDRLAELLFDPATTVADVMVAAGRVGLVEPKEIDDLTGATPANANKHVYSRLAARDPNERTALLDEIGRDISFVPPPGSPRPLTSDQLLELAQHPLITIGAHTHTHPRLTALASDAALEELYRGTRCLDEHLGPSHRLFAYPHGNASKAVARLVKEVGHDFGFTTVSQPLSLLDSPLLLPRIATRDENGAAFAQRRGFAFRNTTVASDPSLTTRS